MPAQVCGVLEERAGGASGETKWVVSSRLRDHLLLPSERKVTALWKEVCALREWCLIYPHDEVEKVDSSFKSVNLTFFP